MIPYNDFLKSKIKLAPKQGFSIELDEINPNLKVHNRLTVKWMVEGGRRACFASFGLGKTVTQLEAVKCILDKVGSGKGLIVLPLNVRHEFVRDAREILKWKVLPKFIRRIEECEGDGIYLTNYETIRDGKLDPAEFVVASLDEASILRGLGGSKTFREFMRLFTGDAGPMGQRRGADVIKYRFVATATPAPNDYIEMLAYADFLGVMDVSQAKTRFFKRDSTQADKLTLLENKEEEFWMWLGSWGLFITKPSDITGNPEDDKGYDLPPLDIHWHEIASNHTEAGAEKNGQMKMFKDAALGIQDASREKRQSLADRTAKMIQLLKENEWSKPEAITIQDQVIDAFFRQTAGYYNLVCIQEGKKLGEITEFSGSSSPIWWTATAKGIAIEENGAKVIIKLKQIQERAAQWERNKCIIWHDLEAERVEIERTVPNVVTIYGSQDYDKREKAILDFSEGKIERFGAKPVIAGSGCNFQRYCNWGIYMGIGFKFNDFIQSIHRLQRFLQQKVVRIDLIYTDAERQVRKSLEHKWKNHYKLVNKMTEIIKKYGLSHSEMAQTLTRKIGIERVEIKGQNYHIVNNDNILEMKRLEDNSIGLILTSIPFSTQYEYSPNYADFGHSESNAEFFEQMDYLTPDLYRSLKPGRIAAIHVKDRIVPMGLSGMGCQTVYPFHVDCINHYTKHGFAYLGMKTIVTDVVRENNQTYRLGWSEQCKDGTKMGVGMPEYLLYFRKPPTDRTNAYADDPVVKGKQFKDAKGDYVLCPNCKSKLNTPKDSIFYYCESCDYEMMAYSRAKWQLDAAGYTRSSGNRFLKPEELAVLEPNQIFQTFKNHSLTEVWDFDHVVTVAETLELKGKLPSGFMLLQPQSWSEEVWTDITRMLTLNGSQWSKGKEMHLCPFQFDIVDRVIEQMTMEGDTVLDPFGGLMTVPYRAILKNRRGIGIELNPQYFLDGASYCKAAEHKMSVPTLFDLEALQ